MGLIVRGRFALDPTTTPPLKLVSVDPIGSRSVDVGRGVRLRLDGSLPKNEAMLNAKVEIDPRRFGGLGSVVDGTSILCASNYCSDWARRNRRPRVVGKVIGVMADEPMYILLTQPKLKAATRPNRESKRNRVEAGLVHFVLVQPGVVECPECPSRNVGKIVFEP